MKIGGNLLTVNNQQLNNANVSKNNGLITNTINDIKANKEVLDPIYSTAANIGIATNVFITITITIIFGIVIYIGFWLKNSDSEKTDEVLGKNKNVQCEKDIVTDSKNRNKTVVTCYADIIYKVDGNEYTKTYMGSKIINENQSVSIYYESSNPDNYMVGKNNYYFGLGMIIVGFLIIGVSWIWLILSIMFKPLAAASGLNAIGDALI